ncbi:hypothetical protein N7532_005455, partial [Penicillium argentinense]
MRGEILLTGMLAGPQRITVPPHVFEDEGKAMVIIMHLVGDICNYLGIVHGDMLAILRDECLTRMAWVEGRMETLPVGGEEVTPVAEAKDSLFGVQATAGCRKFYNMT